MAMEKRVTEFYDEALQPLSATSELKKAKAMDHFRKFLFKNQDFQFSTREQSKLFSTVEAYFSQFDRNGSTPADQQQQRRVTSLPLIEDALKVPCFPTKHKQKMLKWYYELLGTGADATSHAPAAASAPAAAGLQPSEADAEDGWVWDDDAQEMIFIKPK
eukprot:TRINITY_DN14903_c0_g1_i1.p1 TRINITY_DN14903_c0_g1~~TRINITY_DN14903_c0_g1_i1.p1  ORF type:complete len:160 (-),score=38.14 TRINITY_DN14903_c0_g1_i1:219-698(-)